MAASGSYLAASGQDQLEDQLQAQGIGPGRDVR